MMEPREYAFLPSGRLIGLDTDEEIGLLFCVDERGQHWTRIGDAEIVRMLRDESLAGVASDLEIPADAMPIQRKGWPDEW